MGLLSSLSVSSQVFDRRISGYTASSRVSSTRSTEIYRGTVAYSFAGRSRSDPSSSNTPEPAFAGRGAHPRPFTRSFYVSKRPVERLLARMAPLGTDLEVKDSPAASLKLETADYSFYQRMKPSDITEEFLWTQRLAPVLSYLPPEQLHRVREALALAFDAHASQRRKSGEPFITHPVEVTRILGELRMDHESLEAGLLHDTVEDCGEMVGLDEIGFAFGPAVRRIVEGETKFSKLPTHHPERANANGSANGVNSSPSTAAAPGGEASTPSTPPLDEAAAAAAEAEVKAQDLQFLFLAMTEEVRIIIVKLADRLHNMRTMGAMPPGKQRRIAAETLSVFAPLARLLGLYTIKEELEELSFMYAMPQQYAQMRKTVDRLWDQQLPAVEAAQAELHRFLSSDPYLAAHVQSLCVEVSKKALYSLWRKLESASKSVRDVSEIAQLRVVMDTSTSGNGVDASSSSFALDRQLCYHVMGLVHSRWAPIPGSMKDYIATPKPNNYQSLHTTVVPTGLSTASSSKNGNGYASKTTNNNNNGSSQNNTSNHKPPKQPSLFPIEVQIRTQEMERLAQYGIAVESWACADYAKSAARDASWSSDNDASPNGGAAAVGVDAAAANSRSRANGGGVLAWLGLEGLSSRSVSEASDDDFDVNAAWPSSSDEAPANAANQNQQKQQSKQQLDAQTMSRRINWLNSIRAWQQEFVGTLTAAEFVACVTDDLLGQGVFVFTPSGEVMRLPKGATVVDFAYHIHSDVGNTMVAARVNGKVVAPDYELANAEVVEVITYRGPPNDAVLKRHRAWLGAARTKTARHKLAKFLREHAALAASKGLAAPEDSAMGEAQRGMGPGSAAGAAAAAADADAPQTQAVWLLARCDDRQGLLADIANTIARHGHNIRSHSGSSDPDAGVFVMEYELEGPSSMLRALCDELSTISCVRGWEVGCALPTAPPKKPRI